MKNIGLLIIGFIVGALVVFLYNSNNYKAAKYTVSKPPSGVISPDEIKMLSQEYNERYKIINDWLFKDSKTGDNRSSWYKLEDIENYLAYAKQQAIDNGNTLDGLRLYLGAHPDTNEEEGLTTLFFVPTGYNNTSEGGFIAVQGVGNDLSDSDGLNAGKNGMPPKANYPQ
ncbi:hypothetical protein H7F37_03020 [Winogradskyella sp. PAMC22761]|nr:hypothetical protein H7F37_03020 [Winogradskyella sp. PAMC22761]